MVLTVHLSLCYNEKKPLYAPIRQIHIERGAIMAHVAKYTRSALGHMLNHYARQENDGVKRGNQEIKPELTHNNWNVAENLQPLPQMEFIHQRLSQVKVQKRADVNIMCDWVITLPKDVPEDRKQEFFQQSFQFLCDRYGKENVVSAWVHEDETTPHMHFSFIPVTANKKKGGFKVSAKEVLTRKDLQTFHFDLQKHLETALGIPVGVLNQATAEGNQTIAELKRQTAIERTKQAEQQATQAETALKQVQEEVEQLVDEKLHLTCSPKRHFAESKSAYQDRTNAHQSAVAAIHREHQNEQRKAQLDKRAGELDEREQGLNDMEQNIQQHIHDAAETMYEKWRSQTEVKVQKLLKEEVEKAKRESASKIAERNKRISELKQENETLHKAIELSGRDLVAEYQQKLEEERQLQQRRTIRR